MSCSPAASSGTSAPAARACRRAGAGGEPAPGRRGSSPVVAQARLSCSIARQTLSSSPPGRRTPRGTAAPGCPARRGAGAGPRGTRRSGRSRRRAARRARRRATRTASRSSGCSSVRRYWPAGGARGGHRPHRTARSGECRTQNHPRLVAGIAPVLRSSQDVRTRRGAGAGRLRMPVDRPPSFSSYRRRLVGLVAVLRILLKQRQDTVDLGRESPGHGSEGMKRCPNCETANLVTDTTCSNCGKHLPG